VRKDNRQIANVQSILRLLKNSKIVKEKIQSITAV
jgi:hypothetical protein